MNEKIVLATWPDHNSFQGDAPTRHWYRVILDRHGANNANDGQHVAVYVQVTTKEHGFTMGLQDSDWRTIKRGDYPGSFLLETLIEWGMPLPAPTERPVDV